MFESIYFFLFCHLISFIVWIVPISINALKRETIYLLFAILKPLVFSLCQFPPFKFFFSGFYIWQFNEKKKEREKKRKRSAPSLLSRVKKQKTKTKKSFDLSLWPVAVVNTSGKVLLVTDIVMRSTQG